jgi:hypothetical protein
MAALIWLRLAALSRSSRNFTLTMRYAHHNIKGTCQRLGSPESASGIVLIRPRVFAGCEIRPHVSEYARCQHDMSRGQGGKDVYRKVVSASPYYRRRAHCRAIFPDA